MRKKIEKCIFLTYLIYLTVLVASNVGLSFCDQFTISSNKIMGFWVEIPPKVKKNPHFREKSGFFLEYSTLTTCLANTSRVPGFILCLYMNYVIMTYHQQYNSDCSVSSNIFSTFTEKHSLECFSLCEMEFADTYSYIHIQPDLRL